LLKLTNSPPAAAKRRPASQKNFLYNSDFARDQSFLLKRKRKFFCSAPRDYARAAGFCSGGAGRKRGVGKMNSRSALAFKIGELEMIEN